MKKGFTIVELVIVIAVLGVMSAVVVSTSCAISDTAKKDIVDIYNGQAVRMVDVDSGEVLYEGTGAIKLDGYTLVDVTMVDDVVVMSMRRERSNLAGK